MNYQETDFSFPNDEAETAEEAESGVVDAVGSLSCSNWVGSNDSMFVES
jgi:hypothetical protein